MDTFFCFWLVDFFVFLVIGEKTSTNTVLCWIWDLITLLNLLFKPLISCFRSISRCAFVWTFFFPYSCFGCVETKVHETPYIDTKVESIYQLVSYFWYWYWYLCNMQKKIWNINISRISGFEKCPYTNTRLVYDFWKDLYTRDQTGMSKWWYRSNASFYITTQCWQNLHHYTQSRWMLGFGIHVWSYAKFIIYTFKPMWAIL